MRCRWEIDLAFVAGTPETNDPRLRLTGLDQVTLATEPLVLLTPAEHPLASQKSVIWEGLRDWTYIDLDSTWAIRVVNDESFARRKIPRRVAFTVGLDEQRDPTWTVSAAVAISEAGSGLATEFLSLIDPR
jgi:DNA-binding transcriptional LysR family regulator